MSEWKICPLLSLLRMEPNGTPCAGGDCAWWDDCQCLLRSAAEQLEEIAVNTMDLKNLDELPVRLKN